MKLLFPTSLRRLPLGGQQRRTKLAIERMNTANPHAVSVTAKLGPYCFLSVVCSQAMIGPHFDATE